MSIRITDPELLAKLLAAPPGTEFTAADGRVIGLFNMAPEGAPPPGVVSPFSEEELAERRADTTPTRAFADAIRELKARG